MAQNGYNILVAEDNYVNQRLAVKLLQKHGYTVTFAENGKAAVNAFTQGSLDLILMDVQMPEMGGFEATASIRDLEKGAGRIPIIALTAHALKGDREKCIGMGMDDYLSKPIDEAILIQTISKWCYASGPSKINFTKREADSELEEKTLPPFAEDHELFAEMLELLRLGTPPLLERIQVALETGNSEELRVAVHTVKGSLGNFGKNKATRTAEQIEEMATNRDLRSAKEAFPSLRKEIDGLIDFLAAALQPNTAAPLI